MSSALRRALAAVTLVLVALCLATGASRPSAASAAPSPLTGADVSWPECPRGMGSPGKPTLGRPMPGPSTRLLVVGLTNGPAFYPNPCVSSEVAWAKAHHVPTTVYAVTTPPSPSELKRYALAGPYRAKDWRTGLRNFGWAQAQFNLATMRKAGLSSPSLWIDVEFYTKTPWSKSQAANRAVFEGAYDAYRKAGLRVGVYSTGYQWRSIFGSVRYGLPEWHTSGPSSLATAVKACDGASFQGGRVVLSQWWTATKDYDVVCSAFSSSASLAAYFHRY